MVNLKPVTYSAYLSPGDYSPLAGHTDCVDLGNTTEGRHLSIEQLFELANELSGEGCSGYDTDNGFNIVAYTFNGDTIHIDPNWIPEPVDADEGPEWDEHLDR